MTLKIAEYRFYPEDLTIAELTVDGAEPWAFIPFDNQPAELFALDDRHVLAAGHSGEFAVFDVAARKKTNAVRAPRGTYLRWYFAPRRRSVFIPENTQHDEPKAHSVRELPLDGSPSRVHVIADDFFTMDMGERDDGCLVSITKYRTAIYDPTKRSAEFFPCPGFKFSFMHSLVSLPGWISPNGRLMLRPHLGSVVRSDGKETGHRDLKSDGVRRYGVALDVFETGPVRLKTRLVVQYLSVAELYPGFFRPDGIPGPSLHTKTKVLDDYADAQDHRMWDGVSQLLLTNQTMGKTVEERRAWEEQEKIDEALVGEFIENVKDVTWDADSAGFTAVLRKRNRNANDTFVQRHVSLGGEVSEIVASAWTERRIQYEPSHTAIESLQRSVRKKSTQRIALPDLSAESLRRACEEMADRIESGLEELVFRDVLQFRFKVGGAGSKTLDESSLFELIRKLPANDAAPLIPPLRRMMESYGRQAARHVLSAGESITSGGEDAESHAALSDAAWALAEHDPDSFEVLRDWFMSVEQGHDDFAAEKVFPAIARRTKFASPEAARFGLWFFIRQWQGVSYEGKDLGLIDAAQEHWSPEEFTAVVADVASRIDQDWSDNRSSGDVGSRISSVEAMLKDNSSWQKSARVELQKLPRDK